MSHRRRRAKIVCTLGPSSGSDAVLRRMLEAGMDVARLNFSHGTHDDHARLAEKIRRLSRETGREIALLQDLQGPKIRVGSIPEPGIRLKSGARFILTARRGRADSQGAPVSYRGLAGDVEPGDTILLDDGRIRLTVEAVDAPDVRCRVEEGGLLQSHKGINVPGRPLAIPALTAKDLRDLAFGLDLEVDYVALSFVRRVADLRRLRRMIQKAGRDVPIVAKIEKPQAVDNLDEILEASDSVMVARGDLGVELPPERVPVLQKEIIARARRKGRPVITATQMLESMIHSPRPTRAEASDVANAIFDGTDAVMLSGETAAGNYPVEVVRMMARIILAAEASGISDRDPVRNSLAGDTADAVGLAAARTARDLDARVLAVFTTSGSSARTVAKYRPPVPLFAFTSRVEVARRLRLVWGVRPRVTGDLPDTDAMVEAVVEALRLEHHVRRGDRIVITAGTPVGRPGTTNFLKVHRVE